MTLGKTYITLMAALILLALFPPFFVETLELKIYDLFTRYSAPLEPDPRIVIVGIGQKSLDTFGRWPWPRSIIAKLIDSMTNFGVKVTALDVTFSTEVDKKLGAIISSINQSIVDEGIDSSYPRFYSKFVKIRDKLDKDRILGKSIRDNGHVVTAIAFQGPDQAEYSAQMDKIKRPLVRPFRIKLVQRSSDSQYAHIWFTVNGVEPNIARIQSAGAATGFLNIVPDQDGVIRSYPVVMEYKDDFYPSIALSSALLFKGAAQGASVVFEHGMFAGIDSDAGFLEADAHGFIMPAYLGPDGTFPVVSAADIINASVDDKKMRKELGGKIALIGASALQLYDLRVSPFGFTAGVEAQANVISAILNNRVISKYGSQKVFDTALTIFLGLAIFFASLRLKAFAGLAFAALLLLGLLAFNYWMFSVNAVWLNSVATGLTIPFCFTTVTLFQYVAERKSRRFIKNAFSRYLSPEVIEQLIRNPELLKLGGEKRFMTAYFSDVAKFTSISEKLQPTELVALLNEYLSEMTDIIHEFNGTVDKFEGDAIIAFWGAPLKVENHAELCVASAVKMQNRLVEMRAQWKKEGRDLLFVRMGINTGDMVVGNMGSVDRMDYTMMGDAVNLAARLEGANKYYGSNVLISEFTRNEIRDRFIVRRLDKVRVEGKKTAITLYDVIGETHNVSEERIRAVKIFEEACENFHAFELNDAETLFQQCATLDNKRSCDLYLKRIARLREMPEGMEWEGVYDLSK